ncbi:MAG: tripartite tricarboxylate transporter substrate binding protein [Polaromonas sp.]|nr:tripartite tricarboxylate transporter substrate binding protein [Polaromonas sp.]
MNPAFHRARRGILGAAAAAVCLAACGTALAQSGAADYPARQPIRLLVPASPGGTTDILARILAEPLGRALNQSVLVDNKAGGSGAIAAQTLISSPPDGYTLMFQYSAFHVITPQITSGINWDPMKDFTPVAHVMVAPQMVVVRSSLPIHSLAELVEYDRRNPGKLNYASSGMGSMQHVGAEMLNQMAKTKFVHIPYKGTGPALTDLISGAVDFTITTPPALQAYIQQGKLRALAVTSTNRLASMPNVPTVAEAGFPDLQASSWEAIYAPPGLPPAIVNKLASTMKAVISTDEFRKRLETIGAEVVYMGPDELARFTASEYKRFGVLVKAANIRGE